MEKALEVLEIISRYAGKILLAGVAILLVNALNIEYEEAFFLMFLGLAIGIIATIVSFMIVLGKLLHVIYIKIKNYANTQ